MLHWRSRSPPRGLGRSGRDPHTLCCSSLSPTQAWPSPQRWHQVFMASSLPPARLFFVLPPFSPTPCLRLDFWGTEPHTGPLWEGPVGITPVRKPEKQGWAESELELDPVSPDADQSPWEALEPGEPFRGLWNTSASADGVQTPPRRGNLAYPPPTEITLAKVSSLSLDPFSWAPASLAPLEPKPCRNPSSL